MAWGCLCRYVFFSILHCDRHPDVPLMNIKHCTEQFLATSGLNYTVFRLCGFMQVRPNGQGGGGETPIRARPGCCLRAARAWDLPRAP